MSAHYTGEDLVPKFSEGEAWKKVFGPVFVYLNSSTDDDNDPLWLWQDAKSQVILFYLVLYSYVRRTNPTLFLVISKFDKLFFLR